MGIEEKEKTYKIAEGKPEGEKSKEDHCLDGPTRERLKKVNRIAERQSRSRQQFSEKGKESGNVNLVTSKGKAMDDTTKKEAASLRWEFYRDALRSLTLLSLNVLSQKT